MHAVMEMKIICTLLISYIFTKALALQCYECSEQASNTCSAQYVRGCPYQCGSATATASLSLSGIQAGFSINTCMQPAMCKSGRVNFGFMKLAANSQCCQTDQCNNQVVPALPNQPPNGKKCCSNKDCSSTVNCEGDEDRCINATGILRGLKVSLSGCASNSVCDGLTPIMHTLNVMTDVKCCEGNLCNSAGGITQSVFPILGSLFFSLLSSASW